MTKKITFIFLLISSVIFGQDSVRTKTYQDFLCCPDSLTQSHLFTFSGQYQYATTFTAFRTGGTQLSLGLNLLRLITDKAVLGIFVDFKLFHGGTQQFIPKDFSDEFNKNFIPTYSNSDDSLSAYILKKAINRDEMNFGGNLFSNVGIMFSPFPNKFGGFMFTVKQGSRRYLVWHTGLTDEHGDGIEPTLHFPKNYSFELSFKPYAFFKNSFFDIFKLDEDFSNFFKPITITAYYERLNFKQARFYGTDVSQIVNPTFFNKYSIIESYGFKIGYAFY